MAFMEVTMTGFAGSNGEEPERGPKARVSVAYTRRKRTDDGVWEDSGATIWVRVQAWREGSSCEAIKRVRKGDQVLVKGSFHANSWEDSSGNQRIDWQINDPDVVAVVARRTDGDNLAAVAPTVTVSAEPQVPSWDGQPSASGVNDPIFA